MVTVSRVQPSDLFAQGFEHHRAGRKSQAEALYRKLLASDPYHDQALYLSGVIALEQAQFEEALGLFRRAAEIAPHMPAYHTNLGVTLRRMGRHDEAAKALRAALMLKPDFSEAYYNLGLTLIDLGDAETAHFSLERAVYLKPESFDMQRHFARLLLTRGDVLRAVGHYHAAIILEPTSVETVAELCHALRTIRRMEAAIAVARSCLAKNPNSPVAQNELGVNLLKTEQFDEAMELFRRSISLKPAFADPHVNLGIALCDTGRIDEGLQCLRQALSHRPAWPAIQSNILYMMPFAIGIDAQEVLAEARQWDRAYAEPLFKQQSAHSNQANPDKRLRVGYVSPHFFNHCQSFFTTPLFKNIDRSKFETVCYASVDFADEYTERIRSSVDIWRDVSREDDAAVAHLVRQDAVDILIDLTLHMERNRLPIFASKPAPVQISWLAYPGTTGVSAIDYRITDRYIDPPELGAGPYSERSLVLPDTFWCYDPLEEPLEPGALPALSQGHITFGCLNHFRKINIDVLRLWAKVLKAVDNSRLIMLAPEGQSQARTLEIFRQAGIDERRVSFTQRMPRQDYLKLYQDIDICLDSFPYGGHTTSLDAFWMGVPVVTILGTTVVGRAGLTVAANLQLNDLVAASPDEFVEIATNLATRLTSLQELRAELRARMQTSPLMNYARFARNMELAYRAAWKLWCSGGESVRDPIVVG